MTFFDELWALSPCQITGEAGYADLNPYDEPLELFRDPAARARSTGYILEPWWTRCLTQGGQSGLMVDTSGILTLAPTTQLAGAVFAFYIGPDSTDEKTE